MGQVALNFVSILALSLAAAARASSCGPLAQCVQLGAIEPQSAQFLSVVGLSGVQDAEINSDRCLKKLKLLTPSSFHLLQDLTASAEPALVLLDNVEKAYCLIGIFKQSEVKAAKWQVVPKSCHGVGWSSVTTDSGKTIEMADECLQILSRGLNPPKMGTQ